MRPSHLLFASTALVGSLFFAENAFAGAVQDACGQFDFSAVGECHLDTSGGCDAKCTPVNVDVQCSAELYASCNGSCSASADVECTGSCDTSCEASCSGHADFDCNGNCQATCTGHCDAECEGNSDSAHCKAACEGNCSGSCEASCTADASASCQAKCQGSCQGSCKADANASCQIDCQAGGYAKCEADVSGGCKVACSEPKGALFCDGHYVDVGDIDNCIAALATEIGIKVTGNADCSGNSCEASASASCDVSPVGSNGLGYGMVGLMATGLALSLTRRRRASK